jgi:uncharacterized membrane protein YgdD (TMEM256/DUF423 family)
MSGPSWIKIGAIVGGLGVMAGAFGAHLLKSQLSSRGMEVFEIAARYQMYHVPAIIAVGLLALHGRNGKALTMAGWLFLVGTLLFSGSLYVLAVTGITMMGMIAPIGGVAQIIGWFALAIAAGSPSKPDA